VIVYYMASEMTYLLSFCGKVNNVFCFSQLMN